MSTRPSEPAVAAALLQLRGLIVEFGGVRALDGLDLEIAPGEIHGIIGPNGAGKTTVLNALTGFVTPRSGEVRFDGRRLPRGTHRIAALGVGRTFQAPATFTALTAVENVLTGGHLRNRSGVLGAVFQTPRTRREERDERAVAQGLLDDVGFDRPPDTPVTELPYGEHRKIEIARALMFRPRLLLLDEPTAGLTGEEVQAVAALLRAAVDHAAGDLAVVLVEHNVPFVFGSCDRVTALHQGQAIATGTPEQVRADAGVVESYLGEGSHDQAWVSEPPAAGAGAPAGGGEPVLTVRGLHAGYGRVRVLRDVDLEVGRGELVLVYGRNGAGKSTLLDSIAGSPRPSRGTVTVAGHDRPLQRRTVSQIVRAGVALVPQERGVIAEQSVDDNLRLGTAGLRLERHAFAERREALLERFPALAPRTRQLAGTLSGGERQMLALAKVLIRRPQVLMLDEPSIGLAPTVVDELAEIVRGIRDDGVSVLVAEQNVWWVAGLASRAYLLSQGTVAASGSVAEVLDPESLAAAYLGA